MIKKKVELTTVQLGQALLTFKGQPFSLEGYRPFEEIYNCDPPNMTVKCSRQVGKTLSIGAIKTLKVVSRPFFTSLYVSPLSNQASRFSTTYLDPFLNSHLIKKYYRDTSSKKNVFEKTLNNGSIIFLSYAETESDADRVRGVAGDSLSVDEVQDVVLDALPILQETLSASEYAYKRFYGTPKSSSNTLSILFERGTGSEWCTKCPKCNYENIPDTLDNCIAICAGEHGPICIRCHSPIDVSTGRWVSARPSRAKEHLSFHIPRFALASRANPKKWQELQTSINEYPVTKLANEVFGLANGEAGRCFTEREAKLCSNPEKTTFDDCWVQDYRGISAVTIGVDWSLVGSKTSHTTVTVLGFDFTGKAYVLLARRILEKDVQRQVREIIDIFRRFRAQMICSDRGVGVMQGQLLSQVLGTEVCHMVQLGSSNRPLTRNREGSYIFADRTMFLDNTIFKAKLGRTHFETPCWDLMEKPFWSDWLNVFEEETLAGKRVYRKDEGSTDDLLMSTAFANTAFQILQGDFTYLDEQDHHQLGDFQ